MFEFGTGVSYTTFNYSVFTTRGVVSPRLSTADANPFRAPAVTDIVITVTNTGMIAGDDVVLGFLVPPTPGQVRMRMRVCARESARACV